MSNTLKNAVSNGLVGATVSVGYGAVPPAHNLPAYVGAQGSSGQFLTSGSNGTSWSHNNIPDSVLTARGNPAELEVKGRMILNGVDLEEQLNAIEKVLSIPERDVRIEEKHPKLKKLYDEYIHALAKYRTFEAIKGD